MQLRRGLMMGMVQSIYKRIYHGEITANITSTSQINVATINLGSEAFTSNKLVYVKIRDKAGKRNGYMIGTDTIFANSSPANGVTISIATAARLVMKYNNDTFGMMWDSFGLYAGSISSSGELKISGRYTESRTATIDGTYTVDVYLLDYPENDCPFE